MRQPAPLLALLFLLFLAPIGDELLAQRGRGGMPRGGMITGTVVDSDEGIGLPGATIALWNAADSSLVTGTAAEVSGVFSIGPLPPGNYYLKVTSLGFIPSIIGDVSLTPPGSMMVALDTIALDIDPDLEAEAITVLEKRADVEFKSDRTVYNVEDQAATAGGNAIDVLKTVPQVEVDIDDNVSLRGSNNVAVQINGRPMPISGEALAAYLKSLPADMIVAVEVIPNPSAKYDPEGLAGIINIKLEEKSDDSGVSGNVSVTGGLPESFNANGSINWRTPSTNLFSSYGFRYNERISTGDLLRRNLITDPVNVLDQITEGDGLRRSHFLNNALDITLDEKNTLSVSAVLGVSSSARTETIEYDVFDVGSDTVRTLRVSPGEGTGFDQDYALTHRWVEQPSQHELTTEVRYYSDQNDDDGDYIERNRVGEFAGDSIIERQRTDYDRSHSGVTGQIDYIRPIGEMGRLEAGYKGELRTIENGVFSETLDQASGEFVPDVDINNEFVYDENIQAAYLLYNHTFGKVDAQLGLRGELVTTEFDLRTTDEQFENDYTSLYPSGALSYAFSQRTRLRLSMSRRVQRPGVWRLNPFVQYDDRLNTRSGNPELRPEYTNSFELGLNHFADFGTLSISPYYRHTTDLIERWLTVDSQGVSRVSWENFNTSDTYGADLVGTFRAGQRLRGFVSLSLYQFDFDGSNIDDELGNNAFGWSTSANASVQILDWLDFQTNWFYRAPIKISGGEIDAFTSLDAALKASFLDDRASVTLRGSDIFNTMKFTLFRGDSSYFIETTRNWQSQSVSLTFSYDFGSRDNQRPQRRQNRGDGGEGGGGGGSPAGVGF